MEVAFDAARVYVRDSKDPDGAILCFSIADWSDFLRGIRYGDFSDPRWRRQVIE